MEKCRVSLSIMASPKRQKHAVALYEKLKNQGFSKVEVVYDDGRGEWPTGERALRTYDPQAEYHLQIQDDSIIGTNFSINAFNALKNVPQKSLVSFYTGTVRPNAENVTVAVNEAKRIKASWLQHTMLLFGVCIALPTEDILPMLDFVKWSRLPYDFRIGMYYRNRKKPVYYTNPSLVQHDWKLPSLTAHDKSPHKRVAHNYSPEVIEWNGRVINI